MYESDYWFNQRYDDLLFDEHEKGHPNSEAKNCYWCHPVADGNNDGVQGTRAHGVSQSG